MRRQLAMLLSLALAVVSGSLFAKDVSVSSNGTILTVDGIPDAFRSIKEVAKSSNQVTEFFKNPDIKGEPFIGIGLAEIQNGTSDNDLLADKAAILKANCLAGFKADFIKPKSFPAIHADAAGRLQCASKKAAPASPYTEFMFVTRITPTLAAIVTVASIGGNGLSLSDSESIAIDHAKNIVVRLSNSNR